MKKEQVIDSLGMIDDELIQEVDELRKKRKKRPAWLKWSAAAACVCVLIGAGIFWLSHQGMGRTSFYYPMVYDDTQAYYRPRSGGTYLYHNDTREKEIISDSGQTIKTETGFYLAEQEKIYALAGADLSGRTDLQ